MTVKAAGDRLITLDVIRGVAVMGIFSVNIIAFAMIEQAYLNPVAAGGYTGIDALTWFANWVLIDGKMRSLFSILFGASMLLVIDRAVASGQSGASVHFRRMIVLAAFGLAHFYFFWFGDILFLYAVTGMIAFLFRRLPTENLIAMSAALFITSMGVMGAYAWHMREVGITAHSPRATEGQIREWNQTISWGAASPEKIAEEVTISRSGFVARAGHMLRDRGAEPFTQNLAFIPETLALMLLGMAGYKGGLLTGVWPDSRYRKIAAWTFGLGIPISAAMGLIAWRSGFYLPLLFFNFMVASVPVRVGMAIGYAALIILLSRRSGWLRGRLAAVGRAAFTNYLGTSILASLIFYGDGLGLFERLSRFEAWLFVPVFWLLMLAWSKPWLDHFQYGPFEWAWRSLARGRLQPMRKRVEAAAAAAEA